MTNKLNELKQIRDNAPEGATHVEIAYKLIYWNLNSIHTALFYDGECWYRGSAVGVIRSLEDIKAQIELMEQVEKLQTELYQLKTFNLDLLKGRVEKLQQENKELKNHIGKLRR